jgi:hypothetical protein
LLMVVMMLLLKHLLVHEHLVLVVELMLRWQLV